MSVVSIEAPFPGLRFFDERSAHLFFGRDQQVDDLLDKLNSTHFVGVIGPSGCGKSSLVQAGLIPALHSVGTWKVVTCRPREDPIRELAAALTKAFGRGGFEITLRRGPLGLAEAALQANLGGANLLIVIDQFEELFRFQRAGENAEEAIAFVKLLLEGTSQREVPVYVLLTMRSDYLGNCSQFRDLPERLNDGLYLVPRMRRDQLEQAITRPLGVAGAKATPQLVQRLLNDVGDDPDQLPVLQHALLRTWTRWREQTADASLDLGQYTNLRHGLNEHADEVYGKLSERQQAIAATIFKRLTEIDETREVRRPTPMSELAAVTGVPPADVEAVVNAFRADGVSFLNPEPDVPLELHTVIDITHESLIRQWKTLREWAKEEALDRDTYLGVDSRVARARTKEDLLDGVQLDDAIKWVEKGQPAAWAERYGGDHARAVKFVRDSQAERERERIAEQVAQERALNEARAARRQARILAVAALLVAAVISVLGVVAFKQKRQAQDARKKAEAAEAGTQKALQQAVAAREETDRQRRVSIWLGLVREARATADGADADLPGLLARQALSFYLRTLSQREPNQVEDALQQAARRTGTTTLLHPDEVNAVAFSPDGVHLATGSDDNNVRIWDLANSGSPLVLADHTGPVQSLAYSPDGTRLASASSSKEDRTVRVWDTHDTSAKPILLEGNAEPVRALAFGRDGRLASGGGDGKVRIWNLRNPSQPLVLDLEVATMTMTITINAIAFSPDGTHLACGRANGTILMLDLRNPVAPAVLKNADDKKNTRGSIAGLVFSPDGGRVAAASDHEVRLWDARRAGSPPAIQLHAFDTPNSLAFSPDGTHLATGGDGGVHLWDLKNPALRPLIVSSLEGIVYSVAFSVDGTRLASAGEDRTVRIWNWRDRKPYPETLETATLDQFSRLELPGTQAFFGLDGGTLISSATPVGTEPVAANDIRGIRVWELGNPKQPELIANTANFHHIAVSPDGARFAAADDKGRVQAWSLRDLRAAPVVFAPYSPAGDSALTTPSLFPELSRLMAPSLAFSGDGTRLATARESSITVWDARNPGSPPIILRGHEGLGEAVTFSSDGLRVASIEHNKDVQIWDLAKPATPWLHLAQSWNAISINFSPVDSNRLAAGGGDGKVRVWDLRHTSSQPLVLPAHGDDNDVYSLAFSPDGTRLASSGGDHNVALWDLRNPSAQPVRLAHTDNVTSVSFSRDGNLLVSASEKGKIRIWRLWSSVADYICSQVSRNLTWNEWTTYVGEGIEYEKTCRALPTGAGVPAHR